jgi:hypothetical protein
MIAALLAAACLATPVQAAPLPQSGGMSGLRWVQASPHRAGIVGILWAYDVRLEESQAPTFALWTGGAAPEGWAMKILWIIRNVHATSVIAIHGAALSGPGSFSERFNQVYDMSPEPASGKEYASTVDIPQAGCWRLDVSAGSRVRGSFIVRAVSP